MQEVLNLINEMSPYLLLGFFFAGMMHAFVPGVVAESTIKYNFMK